MTFPRSFATLAVALLALTVPAALAVPGPAPGAGVVAQGETDVHRFNNNPGNFDCIQMVTTYTVNLAYAPATDVLTLSAGGKTATGSNGVASVTFQAGVCTAFDIRVSGTQVANAAAYTVTVNGGALGGGAILDWS
jgi:hypothetical protein